MSRLKIIPAKYFDYYKSRQPIILLKHFNKLKNTLIDFNYVRKVSAVYSSLIEGNIIYLETYFKYYTSGMNIKTKAFKEITDLEQAYQYTQIHVINQGNVVKNTLWFLQ
jgi:hypothetical protein